MIDYEALRQAVVAYINEPFKAQFPGIALVYDNQPFDWNNPPEVFVTVELKFHGASQVGAARDPRTRTRGSVYACAYGRDGTGTSKLLTIAGWFANTLKYARLPGMSLEAPEPDSPAPVKGYALREVKVDFATDPA